MNKEEFIGHLKSKGFTENKNGIFEKETIQKESKIITYVNVISEYKVIITASIDGNMAAAEVEMTVKQYEESMNYGIDNLVYSTKRILGL